MTALLEVQGLVVGYGDSDILRGLSLRVDDGELVAVIGPNGAGKSTLLKTLAGLLRPRAGCIALRGADITGAGAQRIVATWSDLSPQRVPKLRAALATAALVGAVERIPLWGWIAVWLVLWSLYLSIVNVGQTWYSFGWESLLCETGFLAIFLGARDTAPPVIVM